MDIEAPPKLDDQVLSDWLMKLWKGIQDDHLEAYDTWDAAEIAVGAMEAKDVTVTGAVAGDQAVASLSIDIVDLTLDAQVTTADTVTCVLENNTAGAVDLDSVTIYVRVFKRVTR